MDCQYFPALFICSLSCFSFFTQTDVSLCQANKIMEHRRKYERKREEKLIRERQERIKKAREEHARAQKVRNVLKLANFWPLHVPRWNSVVLLNVIEDSSFPFSH